MRKWKDNQDFIAKIVLMMELKIYGRNGSLTLKTKGLVREKGRVRVRISRQH